MLIDEALACGCKVVHMPSGRELTSTYHTEDHAGMIERFIEVTQA
jgi:hypothetical protein